MEVPSWPSGRVKLDDRGEAAQAGAPHEAELNELVAAVQSAMG